MCHGCRPSEQGFVSFADWLPKETVLVCATHGHVHVAVALSPGPAFISNLVFYCFWLGDLSSGAFSGAAREVCKLCGHVPFAWYNLGPLLRGLPTTSFCISVCWLLFPCPGILAREVFVGVFRVTGFHVLACVEESRAQTIP